LGGAHRDFETTANRVGDAIERILKKLIKFSSKELVEKRYEKFRSMGVFAEPKR
jgi:acetyl-CoA carboxylase carboxyl transferase subunit alpha